MAPSSYIRYERPTWRPKHKQERMHEQFPSETKRTPWETPQARFPEESNDWESWMFRQRGKGNKCDPHRWTASNTWGAKLVGTKPRMSACDWLAEERMKFHDAPPLWEDALGRLHRLSTASTESDASGIELRSSSSSDSELVVSSSPVEPALNPPCQPSSGVQDITQMRSAHVEAVLSAVILTDATQCRDESPTNEWLATCIPDEGELSRVERCIRELNCIVSTAGPTWRVEPFGSHVNGLALKGSDLDASCFTPESDSEDPGGSSALSTLQMVLGPAFSLHPSFEVIQEVFSAKVPIIKLRFEHSLDVDFSVHNKRPLQNTSLIRAYVQTHPSVLELILAVKMWAKAADVCGASDGKLSCYTFALMAIYFLQVDPQVRLPCLPTSAFDLSSPKPTGALHHPWSCQLPLPNLMARFFRFYSELFDWGGEVVSVRLGKRLQPSNTKFASLAYRSSRRIHVEDPYDLKRNLHCVLGRKEERDLKEAFKEALCVVRGLRASIDHVVPPVAARRPAAPQPPQAPAMENHTADTYKAIQQTCEDETPGEMRRRSRDEGDKKRHRKHSSRETQESQTPSAAGASDRPWVFSLLYGVLSAIVVPYEDADDEMKWWLIFTLGSSLYAVFAMYSGQLFRLALALSALFALLFSMEARQRGSKLGSLVEGLNSYIDDSHSGSSERKQTHLEDLDTKVRSGKHPRRSAARAQRRELQKTSAE